jgi:hypothetical protein
MLKQHKPVGKHSKLTAEAWEGLMGAMRKGDMATMRSGARLPGAGMGHSLQERPIVVVAV